MTEQIMINLFPLPQPGLAGSGIELVKSMCIRPKWECEDSDGGHEYPVPSATVRVVASAIPSTCSDLVFH